VQLSAGKDIERVARVLEHYISPIHARSVLRHALSEHRLSTSDFRLADLGKVQASLVRGMLLFTSESVCSRALKDVLDLRNALPEELAPCSVDIATEADISIARGSVRQMLEKAGAKSFIQQKVTTIVSELARNIVSYSLGGRLELQWKVGGIGKLRMIIRATDRGPGIANLTQILAGDYKSRTGLGRGLIGCKRLASQFDISTGRGGTQVTVEVDL
jgi:serine/threonine-protein kinase RsbT